MTTSVSGGGGGLKVSFVFTLRPCELLNNLNAKTELQSKLTRRHIEPTVTEVYIYGVSFLHRNVSHLNIKIIAGMPGCCT